MKNSAGSKLSGEVISDHEGLSGIENSKYPVKILHLSEGKAPIVKTKELAEILFIT